MLQVLRLAAWLAPIAVVAAAVAIGIPAPSGVDGRQLLLTNGLFALSGVGIAAIVASAVVARRYAHLTAALEAAPHEHTRTMSERGLPIERRLARALNAAALTLAHVESRASSDRLTGVANREALLSELTAEVDRANRYRQPLSVAFIDIDRFKAINDTHGHNSGDAILRQVADLVGHHVRSGDFLGRYGGEEFMLILPGTEPEEAAEVAEKLRAIVMQTSFTIAGEATLRATISVGVAGELGGELRLERLVADADAAMYAA